MLATMAFLHSTHMLGSDDVLVSSGSYKDVSGFKHIFESDHSESFHTRLESADRIYFSDGHARALSFKGLGTPFSYVTISEH